MKFTLVLSFLSMSFCAFGQVDARFTEQKQRTLDELGKQISALQKTKDCIEATNDGDGISKCHEIAKAERKKLQSERLNSQIKKLEDRKQKLEEKKQ